MYYTAGALLASAELLPPEGLATRLPPRGCKWVVRVNGMSLPDHPAAAPSQDSVLTDGRLCTGAWRTRSSIEKTLISDLARCVLCAKLKPETLAKNCGDAP